MMIGRFVRAVAVMVVGGMAACVGDEPGASPPGTDAGPSTDAAGADASGDGSTVDAADSGPTACTDASDTSSDKDNCGRCGHACTGAFACTAGKCGNEVEEMTMGSRFACALLHEGSVWCWGYNADGQLGVEPSSGDNLCGSTHCRATPQKIPGLTDVRHISAGGYHACAVDGAGAVKCWGVNTSSQLAQPSSTTHSATPIAVSFPAAVSITQISAGQDVTCARTTNKDVYCWGANKDGVAGAAPSGTPVVTPNLIATFNHDVTDVRVSMDAGSGEHACALRDAGTVWCWGTDANGEGGRAIGGDDGCSGYCTATPVQAGTISGVTALSVGPSMSCAIVGVNVQCWGSDTYGVLGTLGASATTTPTTVTGLPTNTITTLVQGAWAEFGISASGDVWSWGALDDGALGDGLTTGQSCGTLTCRTNGAVAQLTTLKDVAAIATKYRAGMALKNDGSVVAWGYNDSGQLGHLPNAAGAGDQSCGGEPCHPVPTPVVLP